jgi:hypothetical protein
MECKIGRAESSEKEDSMVMKIMLQGGKRDNDKMEDGKK